MVFGVNPHWKLKVTLIPICIGVALATVNDLAANTTGTIFAWLGIISTSFYQIFVKSKQQDLGLDSYQLLFYQAPLSSVLVFLVSLLNEQSYGSEGWLHFDYSTILLCKIILSSILAFCVNLSIFFVIGKTSPISYNVLGHFKLCVILVFGFVVFGEDSNAYKVIGTIMAFFGVVVYTHFNLKVKSSWKKRQLNISVKKGSLLPMTEKGNV